MRTIKLTLLIFVVILFYSCKKKEKNEVYQKIETTTFNCFCDSLKDAKGKAIVCEPSAAVFYNDTVYFASDRKIPNSSSVFKMKFNTKPEIDKIEYLTDSNLIKGCKYEDFSISPQSRFVFLSSGFDRIKKDENSWDCYNNIYYWNTNKSFKPKLITQKNDTLATSSKYLRKIFANVIDTVNYKNGVPYFKVEGIAAIPGDTLLFGIREYGNSYKDFKHCIKIIAIPYKADDDNIVLLDDAKIIFDCKSNLCTKRDIQKNIALSSLEYNKFDKKLYMLTSYELGENSKDVGAYLWAIKLSDLRKNAKPTLVLNEKGDVLHFKHKSEGIAVINDSTLLIIHDDDRIYGPEKITDTLNQFKRKHNQAAYTILRRKVKK